MKTMISMTILMTVLIVSIILTGCSHTPTGSFIADIDDCIHSCKERCQDDNMCKKICLVEKCHLDKETKEEDIVSITA